MHNNRQKTNFQNNNSSIRVIISKERANKSLQLILMSLYILFSISLSTRKVCCYLNFILRLLYNYPARFSYDIIIISIQTICIFPWMHTFWVYSIISSGLDREQLNLHRIKLNSQWITYYIKDLEQADKIKVQWSLVLSAKGSTINFNLS